MERMDSLKAFWNSMSEQFADYDIPRIDNNDFMKLINSKNMIFPNGKALDIGCGAGKYTLALAPYFKNVIGTDISDKMLEAAEKRRIKEKINNAEYKCMSWQETDITGWEDSFDLVFAHMTPAVNTKESFEKMRKVSKNCCVVTKSVYRKNEIAENIDRICGNITKGYGESELAELFMILWADGITPMTYYEKEIWKNEMSVQSASDSYIKRMSVKKELSESEKNDISRYFASIAKDGMITEITDVILCNVYWRENK